MSRKITKLWTGISLCVGLSIMSTTARAASITVDEIIYNNSPATNSSINGTVDMTLAGNILTIVLTNTTSEVASLDAANNLLTGVGFDLPSSVDVVGGTATSAGGASNINFNSSITNVSGEWGYGNSKQGQFNNAISSIDAIVATLVASTDNKFDPNKVENPDNLAGPEFGLLSASVDASVAGGLNAIQDSITIAVILSGTLPSNLLDQIEAGDVVISFGSSNSSVITTPPPDPSPDPVPLPAAVWMGFALLGGMGLVKNFRRTEA